MSGLELCHTQRVLSRLHAELRNPRIFRMRLVLLLWPASAAAAAAATCCGRFKRRRHRHRRRRRGRRFCRNERCTQYAEYLGHARRVRMPMPCERGWNVQKFGSNGLFLIPHMLRPGYCVMHLRVCVMWSFVDFRIVYHGGSGGGGGVFVVYLRAQVNSKQVDIER